MSTADEVEVDFATLADVCESALLRAGCSLDNARPVAEAIAWSEATGNRICGLFYLSVFVEQLHAGILLGTVTPTLTRNAPGALVVDAQGGFAHPAISKGLPALISATRECGIAGLSVRNSYNCLSLAHHVIPLAEQGLIGLCTSNAPACVVPPGASTPIFGTNPFAFAVPGRDGPRLVIDQSTSATTYTAMLQAAEKNQPIPDSWAQGVDGKPTTNPEQGLAGALMTFGAQKGANVAMIVEILSAVLSGSTLSPQAGQFSGQLKTPSLIGQYLLTIDPQRFAGDAFYDGLDELCSSIGANGLRLPGLGRLRVPRDSRFRLPADEWRQAQILSEA